MAEAELFQAGRFRSAAQHYLAGRPAYAPRLIRLVAQLVGLTADHRVLDLGCGPGVLAAAFAPLAAEVVAVDPEPEMLRIAKAAFGSAGAIRFVAGSSADLSPELGRFRMVTMGRSFHWMDRTETLRRLDGIIEPAGGVALFHSHHSPGIPENAWAEEYAALLRRYSEGDTGHGRRHGGDWVRHEAFLLASAFSELTEIVVTERRQASVEQLIERAFSRSTTAPDRLGAAAPRLAADIEALLRPLATDGMLIEVMATTALLARRPGVEP